jgi:3-dehydroquinate dehydratase-2
MKIQIINGPNLNLLGIRQPEIYGEQSLDEIIYKLKDKFSSIQIDHFQTNHEGQIIDRLHVCGFDYDGIILNAGAYTHTSIAIADAVSAIESPVIELHISNIMERETYRHISYLKDVCCHHIYGKGIEGYQLAVKYFIDNQ